MVWWVWVLIVIGIIAALLVWWYVSFSIGVSKAKKEQEEMKRIGGLDVWREGIQEKISQSNKRMERSERIFDQMQKSARRNSTYLSTLDILEQQLGKGLFSETELEKVLLDKQSLSNLASQATTDTKQLTAVLNKQIKLAKKCLSLEKKPLSKEHSEQINTWNTELEMLDLEVESLVNELAAQDKELLIANSRLMLWVERGNAKDAN